MKKRILSFLLCMVLVVSILPQIAFTANAVGNCGVSATWSLDNSGTLTISGTGAMYDYLENNCPWFFPRGSIRKIVISEGITSIGEYAFYGCRALTSVQLPDSVKKIGDFAFRDCNELESIVFSDEIMSIGSSAFSNCVSLKNVVIPKRINYINSNTFYNCKSLKEITIPNGVKTIGNAAFVNCAGLETVIIHEGVTRIEKDAFQNCSNLTKVRIPDSVVFIGDNVFKYSDNVVIECKEGSLVHQYAIKNNIEYAIIDGNGDGNSTIKFKKINDFSVAVGTNVKFTVNITGETDRSNITYKMIAAPADAQFNASTREFNWTPHSAYRGDNIIRFEVSDGIHSDIMNVTITVSTSSVAKEESAQTEMTFYDVPSSAWYYGDLKSAYDAGIINGKTANEFKPNDNMTYAEAIKLAACLHQKGTTGKVTLENGNPWYQSYVDYCKAHGIIDKEYNYNASATRAGYMMIFANALPDEYLPAINTVYDNSIPDVRMSDPYARSVYKLYRAGIVGGSDQKHNCKPFDNIKRSEVATILARMMFAEKRIEFTLGDVPESQYPYDEPEDTGAEEKEKNEKEPTGLRLDYNKTTLAVGEVDYWTATVYPDDANPSVTWSSANTTVATVDQNGKVTAISPGEARITVITENGLKEAITVTVVAK